MTVKVIVTDMDGTFLDDAKQYDRDRFQAQFEQLKARNIEFVVASGNQYYQLISFFPELKDQISFVAENGALVFDHGEQIFHGELTRHESQIVIGELLKDKGLNFVACGLESAYVSDKAPEAFVKLMSKHYHRLKPISDYRDIDDVLFKFSLNLPDSDIPNLVDKLHVSLGRHHEAGYQRLRFCRFDYPGPAQSQRHQSSAETLESLPAGVRRHWRQRQRCGNAEAGEIFICDGQCGRKHSSGQPLHYRR